MSRRVRSFRYCRSAEMLEPRTLMAATPPLPASPGVYLSRDCDISGVPGVVVAGGDVTASFTVKDQSVGAIVVGCSDASGPVVVDGRKVKADAGYPGLYGFDPPYPAPNGGPGVNVPLNHVYTHTVKFHIPLGAASDFQMLQNGVAYAGPWVTCAGTSSQGSFSSSVPFNVQGLGDLLKIQDRATVTPAPGTKPVPAGQVKPGDTITYALTPLPRVTPSDVELGASIPAGTTLVPGSVSEGGTVDGNDIRWSRNAGVAFAVQVDGVDDLDDPLQHEQIVQTGRASATFPDGSTGDAVGTVTTDVLSPHLVRGTLKDVGVTFPASDTVNTRTPLVGVVAKLVDPATGDLVDSAKTNGAGGFALKVREVGTYTLEFVFPADRYQTGTNGVDAPNEVIGQTVTVRLGTNAPVDVGDVYAPRTFLKTAAQVLYDANNYKIYGFRGIVGEYDTDLFQLNTAAAEAALAGLRGTTAKPQAGLAVAALSANGSATVDPWVNAIRMMAGVSDVQQRMADAVALADTAGKSFSLFGSAQLTGTIGKNLATSGRSAAPTLGQKSAIATRATFFTLLGNSLPYLVDYVSDKPPFKALLTNYPFIKKGLVTEIFSAIRFLSDLENGRLLTDLVFEAAFNFIRLAVDGVLVEALTGATFRPDAFGGGGSLVGTSSGVVNLAAAALNTANPYRAIPSLVALSPIVLSAKGSDAIFGNYLLQGTVDKLAAQQYDPTTDTSLALQQLDATETTLRTLTSYVQVGASTAAGIQRFTRELDGLTFLNGGLVRTGAGSVAYQNALEAVSKGVKKLTGAAAKDVSLYAIFATGIVSTLGLILDGVADRVFVPGYAAAPTATPPSLDPLPVQMDTLLGVTAAPLPAGPTPTHTAPAAERPSDVGSDAAAYAATLARLADAVRANAVAAATGLGDALTAADQTAIDGDLVPLAYRAGTLFAALSDDQVAAVQQFTLDASDADQQSLFLFAQLSAWAAAPSASGAKILLDQIDALTSALNTAAGEAAGVTTATAGLPVPPVLLVDETTVPGSIVAGDTVPVVFTVTNIGDAASDGGTVGFLNTDGELAVQGSTHQSLPGLAAGQSATFTWQVLGSAATVPGFGSDYQVLATTDTLTANTTGTIAVTPNPAGEFGTVNGTASTTATGTTATGGTVTYALSGPGTASLGVDANGHVTLETTGTTRATALSISVAGGDGTAALAGLSVDAPIGRISAPGVTVSGPVAIAGDVGKVQLAGLDTATLAVSNTRPVELDLGTVRNTSVVAQGPVSLLSLANWTNDDGTDVIVAPSVAKLVDAGDLTAALDLGGGPHGTPAALGTAAIGGNASGVWAINGNARVIAVTGNLGVELAARQIGAISVHGDVDGADVLAGTVFGSGGPGRGDSFYRGTIGAVSVGGSINGSLIAAGLASANDSFSPRLDPADQLLGGSAIGNVTVGGSISGDSRIVAKRLPPKVKVGTDIVTTVGDYRFAV